MSVDGNGNWTYALNNSASNVQALDAGDAAVDSFIFNVSDNRGGVTSANVDVTVNGAYDALRIGVLGDDKFSDFINDATDHHSEAYHGTPEDYDVIILNRTSGDTAIRNWVADGGLVITEWSASDWALDFANMIDADENYIGLIETGHQITFTSAALTAGLTDSLSSTTISSGGATEYFRGFTNIGSDVEVLTVRENGAAVTVGGAYGDGDVLARGYDWQDRVYVYSDGVDDLEQVLLNSLEYEYLG